MKKIFLLPLTLLVLSGCATKPSKIEAEDISSQKYIHFSCVELDHKLSLAKEELAKYSELQKSKATSDFWVSIITVVPPSVLTGDYETDVAHFKGEMNAIESARVSNGCN